MDPKMNPKTDPKKDPKRDPKMDRILGAKTFVFHWFYKEKTEIRVQRRKAADLRSGA